MKKFFKPSKFKILLTFTFILATVLLFIIATIFSQDFKFLPKLLYVLSPTIILLEYLPSYGGGLAGMPTNFSWTIFFIISVLYFYLISCLAVAIYAKIKNNSNSENIIDGNQNFIRNKKVSIITAILITIVVLFILYFLFIPM